MLYSGPQTVERLRNVIASIASASVLLVTDNEEGLDAGDLPNFTAKRHRSECLGYARLIVPSQLTLTRT